MHLHYKGVLLMLELFKDPSLSHNLHNFIVFLDSVLTHHLHCIELASGLVSNEQNFREPSLTNNLLNKIVIERLILRSLLDFRELACWYLNSLQLLVWFKD